MKKCFLVLSALLAVPCVDAYKTTVDNKTGRVIEVELRYGRACKERTKFLIKPGQTKVHKHGLCCLTTVKYVARSGEKSGVTYQGWPLPTRLLPWLSCKDNHLIISEVPEDNSLIMEDTAVKGDKGHFLFMENKTDKKIRVKIAYSTAHCPEEEKIIDKGRTLVLNTGKVRAGVYFGKLAPRAFSCCVNEIKVSPVEGAKSGKWFTFVPSKKQFLYGGHCGTLKLDVTETPDSSLFVEATE